MPARGLPTAIRPYRVCALFHRTNTHSCTIRSTSLTLQDVGLSVVGSGELARLCRRVLEDLLHHMQHLTHFATCLHGNCLLLSDPTDYARFFTVPTRSLAPYAAPHSLCRTWVCLSVVGSGVPARCLPTAVRPCQTLSDPTCALFHRTCTLFQPTCALFHCTCALFHRTCTLFHRTCTLFHRTCTLFHRTCTLFHRTDLIPCAVLTLQDMGLSAVGSGCLHGDRLLLSDPTDYAHFFTVPTRSLAPYAAPNSLCRTWVCQ